MDSVDSTKYIKELKMVEKDNWKLGKELKHCFLNKVLIRITVVKQMWLKIKLVFIEYEELIGLRKPT